MKVNFFLITWITVALGMTGCSGIALIDGRTYADDIAVSMPSLTDLTDGDYRGSYTMAIPAGSVAMAREFQVIVRLDSGSGTRRITDIIVEIPVEYPDGAFIPSMISRVVDAQDLDVDSVSGSTFSSKSFLKAVEHALTP